MDVTTYISPPGFHLLDAAGTLVDGLADVFSQLADAQEVSRIRRIGAFLFSIAERGLMTAKCIDDLLHAENAATEALQLFNISGDVQSAAFCARLVVHALRAQAIARPMGVGLEAHGRDRSLLDVATVFLDEEVKRAELHGNQVAQIALSLSRAEIMHDSGRQSHADALKAGEDRNRIRDYCSRVSRVSVATVFESTS